MSKRNLESYYFSFEPTGSDEIDAVLEIVCRAGKGYHHTEGWQDENHGGAPSYQELIQQVANEQAATIAKLRRLVGEEGQ